MHTLRGLVECRPLNVTGTSVNHGACGWSFTKGDAELFLPHESDDNGGFIERIKFRMADPDA